MAKHRDQLAGSFEAENTGGVLSGLLAEEDVSDRRTLWRLGSWSVASVGAIVIAFYANHASIGWRSEQTAAADLARQAQQIQSVAKESQNEARRLASAVDTLNSDRDRLYSRVTVLEQGLDSVTGALARQSAAAMVKATPAASATADTQQAAQSQLPIPVISPVATIAAAIPEKPRADPAPPPPVPAATAAPSPQAASNAAPAATPATPLVAAKSILAPLDGAASKLIEPEKPPQVTAAPMPEVAASTPAADESGPDASDTAPAKVAVQHTEFGVDVGGANSVSGLRALWRGLLKTRANAALTKLRPIIVIRETSTGLGMQLRLVAGPLDDAAAAAKICAGLVEHERSCETAVYDGQTLAMKAEEPTGSVTKPAAPAPKPVAHRRSSKRVVVVEEPPKKPDPPSTLSSWFGRK
jgi:hypothetical protein